MKYPQVIDVKIFWIVESISDSSTKLSERQDYWDVAVDPDAVTSFQLNGLCVSVFFCFCC